MDKAVIQQIGSPETIYSQPVNSFVANFIGVTSLLEGKLVQRNGNVCEMEIINGSSGYSVKAVGGEGAKVGDKLILSLRPEDISLHLSKPTDPSISNVIEGQVIDTIYLGNFMEGRIQAGPNEIGIQIDHYENLSPGQLVYLSFAPEHGLCLTH